MHLFVKLCRDYEDKYKVSEELNRRGVRFVELDSLALLSFSDIGKKLNIPSDSQNSPNPCNLYKVTLLFADAGHVRRNIEEKRPFGLVQFIDDRSFYCVHGNSRDVYDFLAAHQFPTKSSERDDIDGPWVSILLLASDTQMLTGTLFE